VSGTDGATSTFNGTSLKADGGQGSQWPVITTGGGIFGVTGNKANSVGDTKNRLLAVELGEVIDAIGCRVEPRGDRRDLANLPQDERHGGERRQDAIAPCAIPDLTVHGEDRFGLPSHGPLAM
jgi:hypothetical protein